MSGRLWGKRPSAWGLATTAAERAHVNAPNLVRIMGAAVLVCAIYAAAVALLVYAHAQDAVDRTTLFLAGGIGALVPIAALCVAGYRANMGTYV